MKKVSVEDFGILISQIEPHMFKYYDDDDDDGDDDIKSLEVKVDTLTKLHDTTKKLIKDSNDIIISLKRKCFVLSCCCGILGLFIAAISLKFLGIV